MVGACVILNFEQVSMLRVLLQSLRASSLPEGAFLIKLIFEPEVVSNHRDKFGICGFSLTREYFCDILLTRSSVAIPTAGVPPMVD